MERKKTKLILGGYRLEIDIEATRAYYAAHHEPWITCQCAGCRNFAAALGTLPQAVRDFFASLGLEPGKVQELCFYTGTQKTITGDCWYHLVGTVLEGSSKPGDYQEFPAGWVDLTEGFSVGFKNPCDLLPDDFPKPCCQMQFNYTLPWVLEEKNPYILD